MLFPSGFAIDRAGFDTDMAEQRKMAKESRKSNSSGGDDQTESYRELNGQLGGNECLGDVQSEDERRVVAVVPGSPEQVDGNGAGGGMVVGGEEVILSFILHKKVPAGTLDFEL